MCGIAGLFLKTPELRPKLGALFSPMLREMSERGPDSAGIAIYREAGRGAQPCKLSLYHGDPAFDWKELARDLAARMGGEVEVERIASHALLYASGAPAELRAWLLAERPDVRVMSAGHSLEIYKEIGLPAEILERFAVPQMAGSHAIGHTRMATESAVTTEGAHPSTPATTSASCTTARSRTTTRSSAGCSARAALASRPKTTARWRPVT